MPLLFPAAGGPGGLLSHPPRRGACAFLFGIAPPGQRRHLSGTHWTGLFSLSVGVGIMVTSAPTCPSRRNLAKRRLDLRAGHPGSRHGRPGHRPVVMIAQERRDWAWAAASPSSACPPCLPGCPAARFFGLAFFRPALPGRPHQRHQHPGERLVALSRRGIPPLPGQGSHRPVGAHGAAQRGLSLSRSAGGASTLPWFDFKKRDAPLRRGGEVHRQSDDPLETCASASLWAGCGVPKPPGRKSSARHGLRRIRPLGLRGALSRPSGHRGHPCTSPSGMGRGL